MLGVTTDREVDHSLGHHPPGSLPWSFVPQILQPRSTAPKVHQGPRYRRPECNTAPRSIAAFARAGMHDAMTLGRRSKALVRTKRAYRQAAYEDRIQHGDRACISALQLK